MRGMRPEDAFNDPTHPDAYVAALLASQALEVAARRYRDEGRVCSPSSTRSSSSCCSNCRSHSGSCSIGADEIEGIVDDVDSVPHAL